MIDFKHSVIYQIWPRSFKDSNNDGIGDIQGIISKLDYLKELGIDCIWLSPIYASPNDDYGYDISDYYAIAPEYGTMNDFDQLLFELKKRGMSILMDLVANHTSTKHAWFIDAYNNPNSEYRDFYFFKEGKNGNPPNNWLSFFGGSSWTKENEHSYYLTSFAPTQADLNWKNPQVRQEIYNVMEFYLKKGVDGFRMDVINCIDKKDGLPDKNPEKKGYQFPDDYLLNGPLVHTYLKEMNEKVLSKYDALGLAEGCLVTLDDAMKYTNPDSKGIQMTFHFDISMLGYGSLGKYDFRKFYRFTTSEFKEVTRKWQNAMQEKNGYVGNFLSNHDNKRHLERFGNIELYYLESAKALALYNFTLYGTPFIYQGEEIGMTNLKLDYSEWKDYEAINSVQAMHDMLHVPLSIAKKIGAYVTRDNARTPVQWSNENYAGFSSVTPWIKLNPNYIHINAHDSMIDPQSIYHFYKKLIVLRKSHEALCTGKFIELNKDHKSILCFKRINDEEELLILINLTKQAADITLDEKLDGIELLHNGLDKELRRVMKLAPYEAHIYQLTKKEEKVKVSLHSSKYRV
ncbi:glycoside hydrolase family 13 protein [Anaerorhabdus sp.]|uniref:glycoside hydrolase family 13 protein n=1 Tax=Anaerorhabdus sp. TaxID=1872524 RepID=UPI002FCA770A